MEEQEKENPNPELDLETTPSPGTVPEFACRPVLDFGNSSTLT